jgi:hypothetical protein
MKSILPPESRWVHLHEGKSRSALPPSRLFLTGGAAFLPFLAFDLKERAALQRILNLRDPPESRWLPRPVCPCRHAHGRQGRVHHVPWPHRWGQPVSVLRHWHESVFVIQHRLGRLSASRAKTAFAMPDTASMGLAGAITEWRGVPGSFLPVDQIEITSRKPRGSGGRRSCRLSDQFNDVRVTPKNHGGVSEVFVTGR